MAVERCTAKKKFMDFLQRKKLRVTAQRRAIIESAFDTEEHFTAEQLLQWSRRRHTFSDPHSADHPTRSHIICQECNTLGEFDSYQIKKLEGAMCRKLGFSV